MDDILLLDLININIKIYTFRNVNGSFLNARVKNALVLIWLDTMTGKEEEHVP